MNVDPKLKSYLPWAKIPIITALCQLLPARILRASYAEQSKEELEHVKKNYEIAGRVMAIRNMAKRLSCVYKIVSVRCSSLCKKDALDESDWQAFKLLDMGDFIGVSGTPMKTKTCELSLKLPSLVF